jgi:hypothetical protein
LRTTAKEQKQKQGTTAKIREHCKHHNNIVCYRQQPTNKNKNKKQKRTFENTACTRTKTTSTYLLLPCVSTSSYDQTKQHQPTGTRVIANYPRSIVYLVVNFS